MALSCIVPCSRVPMNASFRTASADRGHRRSINVDRGPRSPWRKGATCVGSVELMHAPEGHTRSQSATATDRMSRPPNSATRCRRYDVCDVRRTSGTALFAQLTKSPKRYEKRWIARTSFSRLQKVFTLNCETSKKVYTIARIAKP